MSKKTTNKLMAVLVLLALAAIGYITFAFGGRPQINTVKVSRGNLVEGVSLDGNVKADQSAQLGFENYIPSRITMLSKKAGDSVKKGEVLAQIDNADLKAQYDQAVQGANAERADLAQFQSNLDKEKYKLKSLKTADANSADKNAQREQIDADQSVIDAQGARILAADAAVNNAKAQLAKATIVAPFDGVIAKQDVEVGDVAAPSQTIITLNSLGNSFEIQAMASEKDIAKIHVGDEASVTLDAYSQEQVFKAKVSEIDPGETLQNGAPTYKVTLLFEGEDQRIKSGMNASAFIETIEKDNVVSVPAKSVFTRDGKQYVMVEENGSALEKDVTTGITGKDGNIEITSGLSGNENIVL